MPAANRKKWATPADSAIARTVEKVSSQTLGAYREAPKLIEEHFNLELAAVEGGYGRRQLYELVQNGADELLGSSGRIEVVLTDEVLYCANHGSPLSVEGISALLYSHLSAKKGMEIGRFGLGFKSVLGITTRPEIFSQSGSVRFDPDYARARIESVVGDSADKVPTLRLAEVADVRAEADSDSTLAELMAWATTVVRLRRDGDESSWLEDDFRNFPTEFLLFSPHVAELVLDDRVNAKRRVIASRAEGQDRVLVEGNSETHWRVFSVTHEPSPKARADAGRHADRDEIPIVWAVPTARRGRGEFWAFFPTLDKTTLSGVANAPWKLNEDRTRILEGPFNQELIEALGDLVLQNMEELVSTEDPGVVLDLMPARGRETAGWADEVLTDYINDGAGYYPSVPDQLGELELPSQINLHPEGVPRAALELWASAEGRPVNWCHPSVETRERRPRVELYLQPSGRRAEDVKTWLEALLPRRGDKVAASATALKTASLLTQSDKEFEAAVARACIVLTEDAELVALSGEDVFLRAPLPVEVNARYLHPEVAETSGAREAAIALGIREIEPFLVLGSVLKSDFEKWSATDWDHFWDLVRRSDESRVSELLDERAVSPHRLMVRTAAGPYVRFAGVLLPGEILPRHGEVDRDSLLDTAFHEKELGLLRRLGAASAPTPTGGGMSEPWFQEYMGEALEAYLSKLKAHGANPNRGLLDFRHQPFAGPLTPLTGLSDEAKARYSVAVLSAAEDLRPWFFHHTTQNRFPEQPWPNPVIWMVQRFGLLKTSLGNLPADQAVAPDLARYSAILPVADIPAEAAARLELPGKLDQLSSEHWEVAISGVDRLERDSDIGDAYVAAAAHGVAPPKEIRCRVGRALEARPVQNVAATDDDHLARVFVQTSQPFILAARAEHVEILVQAWGLRPASDAVRTEVTWVAAGESEPLIDVFPLLRMALEPDHRDIQVQPCAELGVETFTDGGRIAAEKTVVLDGATLYRSTRLDDREFLHEVSSQLSLGLDEPRVETILKNLETKRLKDLRKRIRAAKSDAGRLLLAIGADELRRRLPSALLDAVTGMHGPVEHEEVAELALVVHGLRVLQEHQEVLEHAGLQPPARWAGSRAAVEFVRDLGFPSEYAGFETRKPSATLLVEGRPELGPLHDYQQLIVEDIRSLISDGRGQRGLLSLPTGAGKTRVTIEALIGAIVDGILESPILWVAQTEELCEQAVQAWSELWRAHGPSEPVTISRLWSAYEADEVSRGQQVVVATIQKLDAGVYDKKAYRWLARAGCVVVDEAHQSIGQQYTRLLEWQDMALNKERVPLIGLTATPFRGTSEEETKRLVNRYGGSRLDKRALSDVDPYAHLQDLGILSWVDHELLPGSDVSLSADELDALTRTRLLPPTAGRHLGADVERNRTLLESILALDKKWPVLLFAASVEHAQTMAALLRREGVEAASISAETDRSVRRHSIEAFRNGVIRVLTNYNVLTAGFDAPKVRAVYVARPTYSANAYQQMIGRGLRGPLNGGTARCLLVNVEDNVLQYGEQLAFRDFDYLWTQGATSAA